MGTSRLGLDRIRLVVDYDLAFIPIQASITRTVDGDDVSIVGLPASPFSWPDDLADRAKELLDIQLTLW